MLGVVDREVEAINGNVDLLDLEERLAVLLLGVLDSDGHVESISRASSEVEVQETVVLESDPSRLLLDVVRDVLGLKPESREADGGGGGELGRVGGVALLDRTFVVVLEEHGVGNERVGGEADVVDDEIDVGGL